MWFKSVFIDSLSRATDEITPAILIKMKAALLSNPEVIGSGLHKWATLEVVNQLCSGGRNLQSVLQHLSGVEKNAFVELIEFLNSTNPDIGIIARWCRTGS